MVTWMFTRIICLFAVDWMVSVLTMPFELFVSRYSGTQGTFLL